MEKFLHRGINVQRVSFPVYQFVDDQTLHFMNLSWIPFLEILFKKLVLKLEWNTSKRVPRTSRVLITSENELKRIKEGMK